MADFYVPLTKKSTFIKISFPCTLPISAEQKTKDKPKKNQGEGVRRNALTKPEKGWLDYWVMILKNVNFWLVS